MFAFIPYVDTCIIFQSQWLQVTVRGVTVMGMTKHGLGMFKDSEELLLKAAGYVTQ